MVVLIVPAGRRRNARGGGGTERSAAPRMGGRRYFWHERGGVGGEIAHLMSAVGVFSAAVMAPLFALEVVAMSVA